MPTSTSTSNSWTFTSGTAAVAPAFVLPVDFNLAAARSALAGDRTDRYLVASLFAWRSAPQGADYWSDMAERWGRGDDLPREARAYLEQCVAFAGSEAALVDTHECAPHLPLFNVTAARRALAGMHEDGRSPVSDMVRWASTPQGVDFWEHVNANFLSTGALPAEARAQIESWLARCGVPVDATPWTPAPPEQPQLPLPPAKLKRVAIKDRIVRLPQVGDAVAGCGCASCRHERSRRGADVYGPGLHEHIETMKEHQALYARKGRSFGVEIEYLQPLPPSYEGQGDIYNWVAFKLDLLTEGQVKARQGQFSGARWGVKQDGSLRPESRQHGVEIASSILHGEGGLYKIKLALAALRKMGGTVNFSCGLHVHVGALDMSLAERRNLLSQFIRYEHFFDLILPASRRANAYARSPRRDLSATRATDTAAAEHAIMRLYAVQTERDLHAIYPGASSGDSHHRKLANSLSEWGTFEFRQHSGTLNTEKALNWIQLILAFTEKAKDKFAVPFYSRELTPGEEMEKFFSTFAIPRGLRTYYRKRHAALYTDPNNDD